MCGIVGIAGALSPKDDTTMKRLLLLDVFRGIHSTGLAAIRANGEVHTSKLSSHPLDLFELPSFKKALNGNNSQLFIGHNRHATRGAISTHNAHPFEFDNIVGVHNGTLQARCKRRLEHEIGIDEYEVDSQTLFAAIDKVGVKDAMSLVEEGYDSGDGAWSLVWYDKRDHTLNMLRNKWRPMWYAYEKTFKRMFFASRWEEIEASVGLSEAGYDPWFLQDAKNAKGEDVVWKYFTTQVDIHYQWDLKALKEGATERPKPKATKIEYHPPFTISRPVGTGAVTTGGYPEGNDPFGRRYPCGITVTPTTPSTTTSRGKTKGKQIQVVNLIGNSGNPFAGYISGDALAHLVKLGCHYCEEKLDLSEPGHYYNARAGVILCPSCSGTRHDKEPINRIYVNEREFVEVANQ